jgi:Domain of unknown function (DUF222)
MSDKFALALALMREAFADALADVEAGAGAGSLVCADLGAEVDGAQRVINAASAVQALRIAQCAARTVEQDGAGEWVEVDHGLGQVSEFACDCFGPMLAMSPAAAGRRVETAVALASKLPQTLAAMAAGDLDSWRATVIATELAEAGVDSCAAVEALIFPAVLEEVPGAVTRRDRRVLARVDADAVRLKAAKERLERFVKAYPSPVAGLTMWVASLPAADSAACWAAIDDLAHRIHGDDPSRTLGQCRADALVDLMLGNATVTTTVTLMIPVQTMTVQEPDDARERDLLARVGPHTPTPDPTGQDRPAGEACTRPAPTAGGGAGPAPTGGGDRSGADGGVGTSPAPGRRGPGRFGHLGLASTYQNPLANTDDFGQPTRDPNPFIEPTWTQICAMGYEIPGIGVIGGDIAGILERFDTRIARVLLDENTGVVIETSIQEYLPDPAMRRFVQKRDATCRFPGCRRAAKRCEPDHVIPYRLGGPTTPWNLACMCKHHHRVKHDAGWKLAMTRERICTWTDPHGRQYATHPVNHHDLAA